MSRSAPHHPIVASASDASRAVHRAPASARRADAAADDRPAAAPASSPAVSQADGEP